MQQLPGNCRAGNMGVFPKNWKTAKANPNLTWYIKYRFYDDTLKTSKQIVLKGMNTFCTLEDKRAGVIGQIEDELELILKKGYNRITKKYSVIEYAEKNQFEEDEKTKYSDEITESTSFIWGLQLSFSKIKCAPSTRIDLNSIIKYVRIASMILGYDDLALKEIKRKHLLQILEKCGHIKLDLRKKLQTENPGKAIRENWTANTYNQYRSHLGMLFKGFVKYEIFDVNLVDAIDKEKGCKKIRETLTKDQRKTINGFLLETDYKFWRFLQIFFHSHSREIEMLRVKREDVDMENQRFKVLVKKGNSYSEQWRVIKSAALPLWWEVYNMALPGQYLFSRGLIPGDSSIRREQITRRWRRHVKKRFTITADFYSLKHTNTTEMMDLMAEYNALIATAEHTAATMNGHTTPAMVKSIYDTKNANRRDLKMKELKNSFA